MKPYILAETNWQTVKNEDFKLAVLPWGAVEAHNYHLPYATDVVEAEAIAAEAGRIAWEQGAKVIVLPAVPFGVNTGQDDILLDMNMNPGTQQAILRDVLQVLNRQGIQKLLVLNSHGGNDFKPMLRELGLKFPDMFLSVANWYQDPEMHEYFDTPGDHAGEMETSLMLYLKPDLVLPREQWGEGREKKARIKAFNEGWVWTERKWSLITEDTGVGNPKAATKEKGERYFKAITQKLGDLFCHISITDRENLYE